MGSRQEVDFVYCVSAGVIDENDVRRRAAASLVCSSPGRCLQGTLQAGDLPDVVLAALYKEKELRHAPRGVQVRYATQSAQQDLAKCQSGQ